MRGIFRIALFLVCLVLVGCRSQDGGGSRSTPSLPRTPAEGDPEEVVGPQEEGEVSSIFERPAPEPTPETQGAPVQRLMFVCDWTPHPPTEERILADIRLHSGDLNRTPTEADLQALRSVDARVVHVFNVAMVRVEVATNRIPTLIRGRDAIAQWAATVPDPKNFDVELQIFFADTPREEDIRAIEALGGQVLGGLGVRGVLYIVAPDAAVPQLSRLPRVTNVRAQAMMCAEAF